MEEFEPYLLLWIFVLPFATALLVVEHHKRQSWWPCRWEWVPLIWIVAAIAVHVATAKTVPLVAVTIGILGSLLARRFLDDYYLATCVIYPVSALLALTSFGFVLPFIGTLSLSFVTYFLLILDLLVVAANVPIKIMVLLPKSAHLFKKHFSRMRTAVPLTNRSHWPRVSIHLPAYSEPPEVVIATLDKLASLDYPNFEVLVIDNNTTDPHLWRPVEAHCRNLDADLSEPRFRFFHVEGLEGAKAGALNYALERTDSAAEMIALVDADYQVHPEFLKALVPFFEDPDIGFVQTPHDYRDWWDSVYFRACYWEYMLAAKVRQAALNDWVAGFLCGTMCVIRKRALAEAGGWSTWCLTEDTELSVRIHASGYQSYYIDETYGNGLIPETFAGYKKQRRRWAIGPIQQLRRHWRLFMPDWFGSPNSQSFWQRILEFDHGYTNLLPLINVLLVPLNLLVATSALVHGEIILLPEIMVWGYLSFLVCNGLVLILVYRLLGCKSLFDWLLFWMASRSLKPTLVASAWESVFKSGAVKWDRTNKFRVIPDSLRVLSSTVFELATAITVFGVVGWLSIASPPQPNYLWFLALLLSLTGIDGLAAVAMAYLSERRLKNSRSEESSENRGAELAARM